MATRTAIDLATLGAASNDSTGYDCYVSEKGVQALPLPKTELVGPNGISPNRGKYLASFFMDGKTYYIFERGILSQSGTWVVCKKVEFSDGNLAETITNDLSGFFGEVKTVSYMTVTDKNLSFLKESNVSVSFSASGNIIAFASCSVLMFNNENDGNRLTLIKNPVMGGFKTDDVTSASPLKAWRWRSFISGNRLGDVRATGERAGTLNTSLGGRDYDADLILHEDTMLLYDEISRKIKFMAQRRFRLPEAPNDLRTATYYGVRTRNNSPTYYTKWLSTYEYAYTEFNAAYPYTPLADGQWDYLNMRTLFDRQWSDANIDYGDIMFGFGSKRPKPVYKDYYGNGQNPQERICLSYSVNGQLYVGNLGSSNNRYVAEMPARFLKITDATSIDDVWDYADNVASSEETATPSTFWTSNYCMSTNTLFALMFEDSRYPEMSGSMGRKISGGFSWCQNNRLFLLDAKLAKNVFPFRSERLDENAAYGFEVSKFGFSTSMMDHAGATYNTLIDETLMLSFKDLDGIVLRYYGSPPVYRMSRTKPIYTLFQWPETAVQSEYRNAVYYTMIGEMTVMSDLSYFVPSNIADRIVGLWGEDRDIYTISERSVEHFNISAAAEFPVSFVALKETYEHLADWLGTSGLDLLAKNKSGFYLNGKSRVKEDVFRNSSRLRPKTAIKGIAFASVLTGAAMHLFDEAGREFQTNCSTPIYGLSFEGNSAVFATEEGDIWAVSIDRGNTREFGVEFTYRGPRNILLSKLTISTAGFDSLNYDEHGNIIGGNPSRRYMITRDGMIMRERKSSQQRVDFYKLGRGINARLGVRCSGYLKKVTITDTGYSQRDGDGDA
jgi:hypothetical protein